MEWHDFLGLLRKVFMKSILSFAFTLLFFTACKSKATTKNAGMPVTDTITNVISRDGTKIAYEKIGTGPSLIIVNGALSNRSMPGVKDLANLLAENFTVILYDRRGRGESTDTKPYSVDKEIEDLEAVIAAAGDSAYLYGSSGGAVLALRAALSLSTIKKIALYEPPFESATEEEYKDEKDSVKSKLSEGKVAEAVTYFFKRRGMTPEQLQGMQQSPAWKEMLRMGHTLSYDFDVLGDGSIPAEISNIKIPALVMNGEKSFPLMRTTADKVAAKISGAVRKTIKDQTHAASADSIAPLLVEFFRKKEGLPSKLK